MALNNTQPVKQDNCIQNGDPHVSEMLNIKVLEILVYATVSSSKLNLESPEQCGVAKTQKKKKSKTHTKNSILSSCSKPNRKNFCPKGCSLGINYYCERVKNIGSFIYGQQL